MLALYLSRILLKGEGTLSWGEWRCWRVRRRGEEGAHLLRRPHQSLSSWWRLCWRRRRCCSRQQQHGRARGRHRGDRRLERRRWARLLLLFALKCKLLNAHFKRPFVVELEVGNTLSTRE